MKFKRLLINGLLAAAFGVSAVGVESGAFNSMVAIAFADTTPTSSTSAYPVVTRSNPAGSTATLSGTYVWTTDVSFLITVKDVSGGKEPQITSVTVTTNNGKSVTYSDLGTNSFRLFDSGLSMAFSRSGVNKTGETFSFTALHKRRCDDDSSAKTRCHDD